MTLISLGPEIVSNLIHKRLLCSNSCYYGFTSKKWKRDFKFWSLGETIQ